MPEILDDKSEYCLPFILEQLDRHAQTHLGADIAPAFFVGVQGVQGAGKSTLVTSLATALRSPPHSIPTVTFSIDDLYLTHAAQVELASAHPDNPLIQHRGQPSTHDVALGLDVFSSLRAGLPTRIPQYDKSAFQGRGDRVSSEEWRAVNDGEERIRLVIFEGWCVGFKSLESDDLRRKWEAARAKKDDQKQKTLLGRCRLHDVEYINRALDGYAALNSQLDAFVHIDAEDPQYVYEWRLEQEAALRELRGAGMSDEEVVDFVNGYYPAYELYTDTLRTGVFGKGQRRQLRLIIGKDRKVKEVART